MDILKLRDGKVVEYDIAYDIRGPTAGGADEDAARRRDRS